MGFQVPYRVLLIVPVFLSVTASIALSQTISCGQTKVSSSESGHNVFAYYSFSATEGDVLSFVSTVHNGEQISLSVWLAGTGVVTSAENLPDGTTTICSWEAPATANYTIYQDGVSGWGWDMSLTMSCGEGPPSCEVSVEDRTWWQVKRLFR